MNRKGILLTSNRGGQNYGMMPEGGGGYCRLYSGVDKRQFVPTSHKAMQGRLD